MIVDLRSDVLTKPTPKMLEVMMCASMNDDVFGEEPTVKKLEEKVASLTGKEAAIFVVSGTMANQLAIASQTEPHDEVILDVNSHIFQFEQGAAAVLSGVQLRPINFIDSLPDEDILKNSIRFPDIHHPVSKILSLEITHNYNGGAIPDLKRLKSVVKTTKNLGLKIHIDGARIWNAVIATGISIKEYASCCDTMMFCFSKGLGAPIGSILVGAKKVIERARYLRKGIGGGWRKPGMLAAAALYSLENNIERLAEDHHHAKIIAEAVTNNPNLKLTRSTDTNMVFFSPKNIDLETYSKKLADKGILHDWQHFKTIRFVTHLNITKKMVDYTIAQLRDGIRWVS